MHCIQCRFCETVLATRIMDMGDTVEIGEVIARVECASKCTPLTVNIDGEQFEQTNLPCLLRVIKASSDLAATLSCPNVIPLSRY